MVYRFGRHGYRRQPFCAFRHPQSGPRQPARARGRHTHGAPVRAPGPGPDGRRGHGKAPHAAQVVFRRHQPGTQYGAQDLTDHPDGHTRSIAVIVAADLTTGVGTMPSTVRVAPWRARWGRPPWAGVEPFRRAAIHSGAAPRPGGRPPNLWGAGCVHPAVDRLSMERVSPDTHTIGRRKTRASCTNATGFERA